jgi:hypothetical protein
VRELSRYRSASSSGAARVPRSVRLPLPRAARRASTVFGEDRRRAAEGEHLRVGATPADVRWRIEFE